MMKIRQATEVDISRITGIYNYYVLNTAITFETLPVDLKEMAGRVQEKIANYDWLVGEIDREVIGYAYYNSFRIRAAYEHTVESTIFLDKQHVGKGYGGQIYNRLIESAITKGFREMIAVISLPNHGSVKLHQNLGFIEAGVLKNVGYKFDKYVDVSLWQRSLTGKPRRD